VDQALIDGEAVVFRDDGKSDFHALLTTRGWLVAAFVAFDVLRLDGDDPRRRPLEKRREALARLIARRRVGGILGLLSFVAATMGRTALGRLGRAFI
jgi:ATP-dependent DNA ligase